MMSTSLSDNSPRLHFPPVAPVAIAALIVTVIGGIWMASTFTAGGGLLLPGVLLAAGIVLMAASMVLVRMTRKLDWELFWKVFRWSLLAYAISAGMIEYAFVRNHAHGAPLVLVSAMLVVYATVVPLLISYTVAQYDTLSSAEEIPPSGAQD